MFKKSPNSLKTFAPIKSSERRTLLQKIIYSFDYLQENSTELEAILLPDNVQRARFVASTEVGGYIYSADNKALWIETTVADEEDVIVPTVYTLWSCPLLLPRVETWGFVVDKLKNGADLMIPGMIVPVPHDVEIGDLVSICEKGRMMPVAVGYAAVDFAKLGGSVAGQKGKGVILVHYMGDELWASSGKGAMPEEAAVIVQGDEQQQKPEEVEEKEEAQVGKVEEQLEAMDIKAEEHTTAQVDEAFKSALLYGLWEIKRNGKTSSIELPMPASILIDQHVMPYLPRSFVGASLKKSSWKKAGAFLKKAMEKDYKVLKTRDRAGDVVIASIDWGNKLLADFKPYAIQPHSDGQEKMDNAKPTTMLDIVALYKPSKKLAPLFEGTRLEYYKVQDVRQSLLAYISSHSLVAPSNPKQIRLDPILGQLNSSGATTMTREDLVKAICNAAAPYYSINGAVRKGAPPRISIITESRQYKKTATRIINVEPFLVDPTALADQLRDRCASSTSVKPVTGASANHKGVEVMVQGPQTAAITSILEDSYGVKSVWIDIVDKRR